MNIIINFPRCNNKPLIGVNMNTPRVQRIIIGILILVISLTPSLSIGLTNPVRAHALSGTGEITIQHPTNTSSHLYLPVITNGETIPTLIASPTMQEVNLSVISEFLIELKSGEEVKLEISSLSPVSDPVLHLMDMKTGAVGNVLT